MEGIIIIGLQASGKSTFVHDNFRKTHIRLNMDMLKTRHRESIILNACLEGKQSIVIDNTNPTTEEREKYISKFKKNKFRVIGYYFESKIADCLQRNKQRTGKDKIPEVGIKGTHNKLELPSYEEGFDALYYVKIHQNKFIVSEWKNEI